MEEMVSAELGNSSAWENLIKSRVLVTGHTGFKGSWLVNLLDQLGIETFGLSLPAEMPKVHKALSGNWQRVNKGGVARTMR